MIFVLQTRPDAADATPDDEQEAVHPQERLELGQHERQAEGEEGPARDQPASRQPADQDDGAPQHPWARQPQVLPSGGGRCRAKGEHQDFIGFQIINLVGKF